MGTKPTKPEIPQGINGEFRIAIQHLREVGDYRQRETDFKFKIVFWLLGLGVTVALAVLGVVINVALQV